MAIGGLMVAEGASPAPAGDARGTGMGTGTVGESPWKVGLTVAAKESYDSNVYLQSVTPLADQASFVTTLLPQVTAAWTSSPWNARVVYMPEVVFFHAEPSEDHVAHRVNADLGFKGTDTTFEVGGSLVAIDGDSVGLTWTGPGGAPAAGGPAVRDRRDAAIYRGHVRATRTLGDWLFRPAFTVYNHDFRTLQQTTAGYLNFVDRGEFTVGADVGHPISEKLPAWLGYRYGEQSQSRLLQYPEEYDNHFHRVLAGLEGVIAPWLRVSVSLGPEFRTYGEHVPVEFGSHDVQNLYADASITATAGKADTFTMTARNFQQPGFGGRSAYDDLTLDLMWRHRFGDRWAVGAGGRAYNTDFLEPVKRDDWVLSANGLVHFALSKKFSAEVSYVFEDGETRDANAFGREYQRHLVALGLKAVLH